MASGFAIVGSGDAFSQMLIEKKPRLDVKRLLNITVYGSLISGGLSHFWYRGLDVLFGPSMTLKSSLKKILVDQFVLTPPEIFCYMAWAHFGTGKTEPFFDKLKSDYLQVLIVNYQMWLPLQFINFFYVPERHRVLFQCFFMMIWATFLSYASHNELNLAITSN